MGSGKLPLDGKFTSKVNFPSAYVFAGNAHANGQAVRQLSLPVPNSKRAETNGWFRPVEGKQHIKKGCNFCYSPIDNACAHSSFVEVEEAFHVRFFHGRAG